MSTGIDLATTQGSTTTPRVGEISDIAPGITTVGITPDHMVARTIPVWGVVGITPDCQVTRTIGYWDVKKGEA